MIISIDLGGTKLQHAIVADGNILHEESCDTLLTHSGAFIDQLTTIVSKYMQTHGADIQAVAIGVPGPVKDNIMQGSKPLEYMHDLDFNKIFESLDIPLIVKNDLHMAAHAELHCGAGIKYKNFALISLSTGIGTAFIYQGEIVDRSSEMGHTVLNHNPTGKHQCTNHADCWVSQASGNAIKTRFGNGKTAEELFETNINQNELDEVLALNAHGIGSLINAYDPEAVVIMGSLGLKQFGKIIPGSKQIGKYTIIRPVPSVIKSTIGEFIGVIGGYYAATKMLTNPDNIRRPKTVKHESLSSSIGFIGLGRMGLPMCQLVSNQLECIAYDIDKTINVAAKNEGISVASDLADLVSHISPRRVVWLMIPAGKPVEDIIEKLLPLLSSGDIIVDGGNSNFTHSQEHDASLAKKGISFVSIGTSGGINGARSGPPMTVSCDPSVLEIIKPVLNALGGNYTYYNKTAYGHLAKGIHNAIEYGMMQSIAEGVALYFHYGYTQDEILATFKTWSSGSIIESALVNQLITCLQNSDFQSEYGIKKSETLALIKQFTNTKVPTPAIDAAVKVREKPENADNKTVTTLALLRKSFGGHETVE